ncbi:MAG: hypothetical protein J6B89_03770 [Bacilli bacterium]|nr:hypothetical protein [Bacilli bacterium]
MKNAIEYFYNFPNITIHELSDKITFKIDNQEYHLLPNIRNYKELEEIYNITRGWNNYYPIIRNKNNSIVTNINNKEYILIKIRWDYDNNITIQDIMLEPKIPPNMYTAIKRNNWSELLQRKIDFFIYQREHIRKKYLIIDECLDYYIGMTENAISYLNAANASIRYQEDMNITISHRRILKDQKYQMYNPLNIVIDHKARDISEYLKLLFINNQNTEKEELITKLITNLKFNEYDYKILMARMLYPSFFFDKYEQIVNYTHKEEEILPIIKRIKPYEEYIKKIYEIISYTIQIPKVEWILK